LSFPAQQKLHQEHVCDLCNTKKLNENLLEHIKGGVLIDDVATHMNRNQKKGLRKNSLPLIIANTALAIENVSPAACNRDCAIPFPVPVSHVMSHTNT
jgi:hypothetical protein